MYSLLSIYLVVLRPNAGHDLLIHEVSRSHTTTHHSRQDSSGQAIGSSQRPLSDNTQHSQQKNIHTPGGIRTHDLSRRAAADLRLRPRVCWDLMCGLPQVFHLQPESCASLSCSNCRLTDLQCVISYLDLTESCRTFSHGRQVVILQSTDNYLKKLHIFRRSCTILNITNSKINGGTTPPSPLFINSVIFYY